MKNGKLKYLRLITEILVLLAITLSFFAVLPKNIQPIPVKTQFVPMVISVLSEGFLISLMIVVFFLVITTMFGRLYCSFVCPLGGFQDFFIRLRALKIGKIIKKKRYSHRPALTKLRLAILIVTTISVASGGLFLLSFVDPYSLFGKIVTYVVKPAAVFLNNHGLTICEKFNWDFLTAMTNPPISLAAAVPFAVFFMVVLFLSLRNGRLYCNAVCPLGTFLGLFAAKSLYKIRIDSAVCNSCGICERGCKAECIDSKKMTVDNSSCIKCFNCVKSCKKDAIRFQPVKMLHSEPCESTIGKGVSRREVFAAASGTAVLLGTGLLLRTGKPLKQSPSPATPPGSIKLDKYLTKCTSCYLCVNKCPTNVLQPSSFQFGLTGAFVPYMDFNIGYCDYECKACLEVCPNDAIMPYTLERKKQIQIGLVKFTRELCDVVKNETGCGACIEMCPTDALTAVTYKKDLEIPLVKVETCIGCGACQYVCPAQPKKAIVVDSIPVHLDAEKSKKVTG
jgi:ferredoxin